MYVWARSIFVPVQCTLRRRITKKQQNKIRVFSQRVLLWMEHVGWLFFAVSTKTTTHTSLFRYIFLSRSMYNRRPMFCINFIYIFNANEWSACAHFWIYVDLYVCLYRKLPQRNTRVSVNLVCVCVFLPLVFLFLFSTMNFSLCLTLNWTQGTLLLTGYNIKKTKR